MAFADKVFFTMDSSGLARAWTKSTGALLWETQTAGRGKPGAWAVGDDYVVVSTEGDIYVLKAHSGAADDIFSSVKGLHQKLKSGETPQVLSVVSKDATHMQGVIAYVKEDGTTSRIWSVSMDIGNDEFSSIHSIDGTKVVASSVKTQWINGSFNGLGLTSGGAVLVFSLDGKSADEIPASSWSDAWVRVVSVRPTDNASIIAVHGVDGEGRNAMGLFEGMGSKWRPLIDSRAKGGVAFCPAASLIVAMGDDSLEAYIDNSSTVPVSGDVLLFDGNFVENLSVLECTSNSFTVLLSTAGGTTRQINFAVNSMNVASKVGWSAEEGLAFVSSAVVLDASHLGLDDLVEEQDIVSTKLSLSGRLTSQVENILSLFSTGLVQGSFSRRDHIFGFVKIAVMLSQKNHRMWGMNTAGTDRGSMRWSLDLPKTALWHTMVHGTTNSAKAVHGINGGTHSREILVISVAPHVVEWKCIDGTNGHVHAESAASISSPVSQVIPIYGYTGSCRQASLLLHEDHSLSVIPGDAATVALVKEQLTRVPNGIYTHIIDKATSKLESYQVATIDDSTFTSHQVGRTSFTGERIVKVAYPIRDEMVQTMSTILGDNSLLLKYLNPHLAVVITVTDDTSKTSIAESLEKAQGTAPKRKPAGVGDAAATAETKLEDSTANLFVNLVDTVSGRILHRMSHSNADVDQDMTALITENWVIYSFVNAKTRRTELGVLTLHEGMIDPKGIGLFTSPEQSTSFSSFDVRESKPVVLSKTYVFPKRITALGVTATRGGISGRNILIASDDGKITSVNRMMLETRRPMGEVKDVEKMEGLFPYNELIVQIPYSVISYNQTLEAVTSVVSAPTALESQSLVLAFGGPDIFFTRTSPSKGFDLLPDSFSRVLVTIVSTGLVVVLFVVKRIGSQRALKSSWI
jgi:hypothetical protein